MTKVPTKTQGNKEYFSFWFVPAIRTGKSSWRPQFFIFPSIFKKKASKITFRMSMIVIFMHMKKAGFLLFAIFFLAAASQLTGQDGAGSYKVIVNQANPVTSLTREQVSKLFLKKITQWPRGGAVHPVDLVDNSPVREKFCKEIHGKSVTAIKAFWQQRIFSGRDVPPPEKATDAEVITFVVEQVQAIGYVSANAPIGKVKVLQISELPPSR
jgi:hypothetical protein